MKINSIVGGIAVGLLLGASVVWAQGSADHYPFTKGKIVKLETASNQVLIKTPHGSVMFDVTPNTYLINGQTRITIDKLAVGDGVKLNYFTNETGQAIIRRLKVDQPESTANEQK